VEEAATNDALVENANVASGLNDWAGGAADAPADDWAASADAPKDDWAAPPAAEGAEKPQSGEKRERRGDREEEEDNTLTFDQYLAQQREKENALVPKLDVRKPNDGADDDVFKGAAPLQKDDLEYFAPKAKSAPKARTKKEDKVFIEIEARFERPSRGGRGGRGGDRGGGDRGRGERSRGRGGRGRGGANGYSAPASSAVNVDDETAFPSLS
jgi:plasminogen activator inhibitor 1 RNA-binding protein